MKLAVILTLVLSASAQTYSGHSGWNFADTLQTATDVLVADITAGSAVDTGSQVTVKATLHVIRVLSGGIASGAELTLQWHYQPGPGEGPAVTTKVTQMRGLWFLHKNPQGALEPLSTAALPPLGGSLLPLAAGMPSGPLSYTDTQSLPTKVARELAAAIEDLALQHGADLAHRPEPFAFGAAPAWVQTRMLFQSLTMVLQSIDPKATADVYQYFSTLPHPILKTLGIFARLNSGDISAVFDLEKNLPIVLSTLDAMNPAPSLMNIDLRKNLAAAHALARIALSETTVPGMEGSLAFSLAGTRNPEFLPYLVVMLGSPNSGVRGAALMGFCQLLGPSPTPTALWSPEMAGYCPNGSPMNNRDLEQQDTQFWKQWWQTHRDQIAKTVALPTVRPPSRYSALPNAGSSEVMEIPVEVRFESLLHQSAPMPAEHYHSADGTLVEGPPQTAYDPVSGQLDPADRVIFRRVVDTANAKLAAVQTRSQQIMNAARIAGTMPDVQQSKALNADRESALKAGLDEMQSKVSPKGWQAVERFLKSMGAGMSVTRMAPK